MTSAEKNREGAGEEGGKMHYGAAARAALSWGELLGAEPTIKKTTKNNFLGYRNRAAHSKNAADQEGEEKQKDTAKDNKTQKTTITVKVRRRQRMGEGRGRGRAKHPVPASRVGRLHHHGMGKE